MKAYFNKTKFEATKFQLPTIRQTALLRSEQRQTDF